MRIAYDLRKRIWRVDSQSLKTLVKPVNLGIDGQVLIFGHSDKCGLNTPAHHRLQRRS